MRLTPLALVTVPLLVVTMACAPKDEPSSSGSSSTKSECAKGDLALKTPGKLTIATDTPAYDPWFSDNDPTNGKGFESAVAYAVAGKLGFDKSEVTWIKEPFNNSYAPGAKKFDFDINQISITPERAKVGRLLRGLLLGGPGRGGARRRRRTSSASSLADLKSLRLGAQTGTTSLTVIREDDQARPPTPLVFNNTNTAKQALLNDQVDAIVVDLPTAFYITAAEIPRSTIVGQFQPTSGRAGAVRPALREGQRAASRAWTRRIGVAHAMTAPWPTWRSSGCPTPVDVPVLK